MLRRLCLTLAVVLLVTGSFAQDATGTWTAKFQDNDRNRINFQFMQEGDRHSRMGDDLKLTELTGLSAATMTGPGADVKFELRRDAGVIAFDGHFRDGYGVGKYSYTASLDFLKGMSDLGYPNLPSRQLFAMAVLDVSRNFTKELKSLGFNPSLDKLIAARIFNVNREQIEGLRSVGYEGFSLDKLIELRIHGVSPDYIKEMRGAGLGELDLDKLVAMKIHGATPEFRRKMAEAGYPNLSADRLIEFRIHGVTPEFVKEMAAMGFRDLSAQDLVQMRIFRVNSEQVEDLKKLGYTGLSVEQLVTFRIHHIDRDFIERVQRAGYKHPSVDQLVEFKIMGIRARDSRI